MPKNPYGCGFHCPRCNSGETVVGTTRVIEKTNSIKRYRRCLDCDLRFITSEKISERLQGSALKDYSAHIEAGFKNA